MREARSALATSLLLIALGSGCAPSKAAVAPPPGSSAAPAAKAEPHSTPDTVGLPGWLAREIAVLRLVTAEHAMELPEQGEHVVISKSRVIVDGHAVADVAQIAAAGKLKRVDGLFDLMKVLRERFKAQHPDEPFHGVAIYWVDASTSALVLKSVFQTCAFAGYPNGNFVVRRSDNPRRFGRLAADAMVPGPPATEPGGSGTTTVSGRLPPEVIQRIVRQNYGTLRACYAKALEQQPELEGRVVARFVIGRDGSVTEVRDGGSTLQDRDAVDCVLGEFGKLRFPAPQGGSVTVVYPIQFEPE